MTISCNNHMPLCHVCHLYSYSLFSVVEHIGTLQQGHYVARLPTPPHPAPDRPLYRF